MTRSQLHAGLAFGSVFLIAGVVAFVPPIPPASAQNEAERVCADQNIKPGAEDFEWCLSEATRAFEWGKPEIARALARVAADARAACIQYGLTPATSGYKACLERESHARRLLVVADEPQYGKQIAQPH